MSDSTSPTTSAAQHGALQFSLEELAAGGIAGFAEHFVMFPCDTIKTRMQCGGARSICHVVRHLWSHERLTHLYRGCVPVLVSAIPAHGAYFSVYEALKRLFGDDTNMGIAAAASFSTVAHDTVSTPFDVIKQRMQMDKHRCFSSSVECAKRIVRTEGVGALFASLPTTVIMNIPHFSAYWLAYEGFLASRGHGNVRNHQDEMTVDYMAAGFVAGACAAVVSFPFDTVKTYLQLGHGMGFRHTLRELIQLRGMRGVYSGVVPRILYTAPSGAIMMVTYETVKSALASDKSLF
ncbi:MIT1_mitochondrial_iron_importer [Leishmania major strain Friedlin]|nr:MIT1_mitochondrial_iron_importer [Leishmania major strain Friedlin]